MSAIISACALYRYRLERQWQDGEKACFIMLNPSTADAALDDPTIRRCIGYAKTWGYGGLVVVNLFAFRATNPKDLRQGKHTIGLDNDRYIQEAVEQCGGAVAAWGAHGSLFNRASQVTKLLKDAPLHCLALTSKGQPKHPLYLAADLKPIKWNKL